jgi:4,5-DOPA dioxygenase extradiol
VPLRFLVPDAGVPVVEISLPRPRHPELVSRIGEALAPLRDDGVMLVGSGGGVHSLAGVSLDARDATPAPWAREFDEWLAARVAARDFPALLSWREAPAASLAHPTPEHLDPLLFVAGASREADRLEILHEGIEYGSLAMRTFALV